MANGSVNKGLGLRASSSSLILFFNLIFSSSFSEIECARASPMVRCNLRSLEGLQNVHFNSTFELSSCL
jgi:hypothetical protein